MPDAWSNTHQYLQGEQATHGGHTYEWGSANPSRGVEPPAGDWTQMDVAAAQSGSSAGAPAVRKFPFAFDTPGLLTGATVYTPTVGDLLLDLWIEIDTTWDGTTPLCDVGMFIGANRGWFAYNGSGAVNMALTADSTNGFGYGVLSGGPVSLAQNLALSGAYGGNRQLPARFTIADPVKVVVSQDGTNTGANPGSTQGAAVLYVVTATPA